MCSPRVEAPRISPGFVRPEANHTVCPCSQHVYKDGQIYVNFKGSFELKGNVSLKKKSKGCVGMQERGHPVPLQDGSVRSCDTCWTFHHWFPHDPQHCPYGSCIIPRACSVQQHSRIPPAQCDHPDWPKPPGVTCKSTSLLCK